MNYVDSLNLFGVEARQINCIKINGAPTATTEGAVGVLAMDIDSKTKGIYKCTAVNEDGTYTWEILSSGNGNNIQVQNNWNQNDKTQPDYIQNRTHYIEIPAMGWTWRPGQGVETESIGLAQVPHYIIINSHNSDGGHQYYTTTRTPEVEEIEGETIYTIHLNPEGTIIDNGKVTKWNINFSYGQDPYVRISRENYNYVPLDDRFIPDSIPRLGDLDNLFKEVNEVIDSKVPYADSEVTGDRSFVIGKGNVANGDYSLAGGEVSKAMAPKSLAFGNGAVTAAKCYLLSDVSSGSGILDLSIKNLSAIDSLHSKLSVGDTAYVLNKSIITGKWRLVEGIVTNMDGEYIEFSIDESIEDISDESWYDKDEDRVTPYLFIKPNRYMSTFPEIFSQGPDAIAFTTEQVNDLKETGIFVAQHAYATAMNHLSTAFGNYSFAINNRGLAIGNSSFAGGQECISLGGASLTFGQYAITGLKASSSISFGHHTYSDAPSSQSFGQKTIVLGDYTAGFGIGSDSWDDYNKEVDKIENIYWRPKDTNLLDGDYCPFGNMEFTTTQKDGDTLVEHLYTYYLTDNATIGYTLFPDYTPNKSEKEGYNEVKEIVDKTDNAWLAIKTMVRNSIHISLGNRSLIYGSLIKNFGNNSIVGGENNYNFNRYGCVIGKANYNYGMSSTIFGQENRNLGDYSLVMGKQNSNKNNFNVVFGNGNFANSNNNFIFGQNNRTNGKFQYVVGDGNSSITPYPHIYMMGQGLSTSDKGQDQIILGKFNAVNNARFIVGNGTASNKRANAFEIYTSGDINFPQASTVKIKGGKILATQEYVEALEARIEQLEQKIQAMGI